MAYKKMGYKTLMDDALRVLKLNFPESPYVKKIARMGNGEDDDDAG
jgi:outer membrane protein assembly factor BamD (BamD/ComL family)